MRLSDEKARRLTALVWRERARRWVPVVALVLALGGAFTAYFVRQMDRADRTVDVQVHAAAVLDTTKLGTSPGAGKVHIHLDDGRDVEAFNTLRVLPAPGAHVVVNEARHASGKLTFDVMRIAE